MPLWSDFLWCQMHNLKPIDRSIVLFRKWLTVFSCSKIHLDYNQVYRLGSYGVLSGFSLTFDI